jgi:MFS family permease
VRVAKESLSGAPSATVYVPAPVDLEVHVTREELETLVRPDLERTVEELLATVERAGSPALKAIYLVGGGSRMPLVGRLVAERTGITPTTWGDPKASVALGAAVSRGMTETPTGVIPIPLPAAVAAAPVEPEPAPRAEPTVVPPPRTSSRRKPVLLGSVAAFGLFSLLTATAHSYDALLWARLATGLGFGGAMPNLIAVAVEISKPERRAATVSAMFCGMPAGGATSALIARLAGDSLEWRTIFIAGGALPLLLLPVIFLLLPETKPPHDPAADRNLGRALFAEQRAAPTVLIWLAFMMTLVVLYLALNWLPTLVVDKGHPPSEGFMAAMVFNIAGAVGSILVGAVAD